MLNNLKDLCHNIFYKTSIKAKLFLFIILLISCIVVIGGLSLNKLFYLINEYNDHDQVYYKINALKIQNSENKKLINQYIETSLMEDLQSYNEGIDKFEETLETLDNDLNSLSSYFILRSINNAIDSYYYENNMAIKMQRNNDSSYYIYLNKANRIHNYIEGYMDQLLQSSLNESKGFYSELIKKATSIKVLIIAANIIICLLGIIFALLFSNYITKYLNDIISLAGQISKGNVGIQGKINKSHDEVGTLTRTFDNMSIKMKEMLDDLKTKSLIEKKLHEQELENIKMEASVKDAKFLALHSQINPHFLFNTLNTISRMAMFENAIETRKLTQALARLLRYNLDNHFEYISLDKELENLEQYINIQKVRFKERINFENICAIEDKENVNLPPFILQPLVENSIIHGLEPVVEGGTIRIEIKENIENILIIIKDNGIGMSSEHLNKILMGEEKTIGKKSIGINNVYERLKIFTGNKECMKIDSEYKKGTTITVTLAKKYDKKIYK